MHVCIQHTMYTKKILVGDVLLCSVLRVKYFQERCDYCVHYYVKGTTSPQSTLRITGNFSTGNLPGELRELCATS